MALEIVGLLLGLIGVAGTFLPVIPGVILIYAGIVLAAFGSGFELFSPTTLVLLLLVTAVAELSEHILGAVGAKWTGATRWGIGGAIIGGIVGLFVMGPVGILVGPLLGALIGEVISGKPAAAAFKAAMGASAGALTGTLFRFAVGLVMYIYFVVRVIAQNEPNTSWWA